MKSKYELLAPVGDFRNLRAAVEAGCDAVYFGVRGFNMRDSQKALLSEVVGGRSHSLVGGRIKAGQRCCQLLRFGQLGGDLA